MADNVTLDPGSGGVVVAADDISSVYFQRVKLVDGTDGGTDAIQGTAANGLEVDVTRVAGTVTISGSVTADTEVTTADLDTGAGTDTRAVVGLALAASGGAVLAGTANPVPISDNSSSLTVDDGGSSLTVDGSVSLAAAIPAGTNNIGDVDVLTLPALAAGTNNIGDVDVLTLPALPAGNNNIGDVDLASAIPAGTNTVGYVGLAPRTSGGLSIFRTLDADETEEEVSAVACQLYGWFIYNDGAAEVYVKLYNATAANVTVGTTTPVMTLPIPAGAAANVEFTNGIEFSTALCVAATTEVADNGTTAPAANQVVANLFYK